MLHIINRITDLINLLSKLNWFRIYNYALNSVSFLMSVIIKKECMFSMPFSLSIEPTSYCNLRCPHCPTGQKSLKRPQGFMSFETYKHIIDEASQHLIYLILYFQGEPFIHKQIIEMIKYARSKNLYTMTSSNAHFIDKDMAAQIVESGLDKIIISFDGVTSDVYAKYRIGGEFEKVMRGIEHLINYKNNVKSNTPFIELQFLVLKHNEHEMKQAKALAKKLGVDNFEFKSAQIYDVNANKNYIPASLRYSRYVTDLNGGYVLKKKLKNRCYRMWTSSVITWDAQVVPCCYDKDAEFIFGNVCNDSLKNIWYSQSYKNFRNKILKSRKTIDICSNCGG